MPSSSKADAVGAGKTNDEPADATNAALVIYGPSAAQPTDPDPLSDVVKASEKIRDNTSDLIDMIHEAFRDSDRYTKEEIEEMLSLAHSQLDELYSLSMEVKEHTDATLHDTRMHCGADMQRQALQYMGQEQHLKRTVKLQQGTIESLQQNLSHLTLHTGLLRGENQGLSNENFVLRQRLEQAESSKNLLQKLSRDLSSSLSSHHKEVEVMNQNHQLELTSLAKELDGEKLNSERTKAHYEKLLSAAVKDMKAIKKSNEEVQARAEAIVNASTERIDQKCEILDQAAKMRASYEALQEKEKKAQEEYKAKVQAAAEREEEAKNREKAAIEKYEDANAKFENLQTLVKTGAAKSAEKEMLAAKKHQATLEELKEAKKAYDDLLVEFNQVKELSEYFAREAKEANARELESLVAMQRMASDVNGE